MTRDLPRSRIGSWSASAATLLLVVVSAATGIGQARAADVAAASRPTTRHVMLPTGDAVTLTRDATGEHAMVTAANTGVGGSFMTMKLRGDTYVVPNSARPYLGEILDPALFDVTELAQDRAGSVPVTVTFQPDVKPHALPGIALTSVTGSSAAGLITANSSRAFGAALASRAGAGAAAALSGVRRVTPAVKSPPPVITPHYVMETLTVKVTLPATMTSSGITSVIIENVDDSHRYALYHSGTAPFSVSVPKGHYTAMTYVEGVANRSTVQTWIAVDPQFTVDRDSAVTIDAGKATRAVTASTPQPAAETGHELWVARTDALGAGYNFGIGEINAAGRALPVLIAPTKKAPTVGKLSYEFAARLSAPAGVAKPYVYDLDFAGQDVIPAALSYTVTDSELATIHERFGTAGAAYECPFPYRSTGGLIGGSCPGFSTPVAVDEHITAQPGLYWSTQVAGYGTAITPTVVVGTRDSAGPVRQWRTFTPGEQLDESWFAATEAPSLAGDDYSLRLPDGSIVFDRGICPACRTGSGIRLLLEPRGTADYVGTLDPKDTATYAVYADGVVVRGGGLQASGGELSTAVTMPAAARTFRIDYDVARDPANNTLSTVTHTSWQIPARVHGRLPDHWTCDPSGTTACATLPLLTATFALPTDSAGRLPSGTATGSLAIGHVGTSTGAALRSLKIQVSYDGGAHWSAVQPSDAGNGRYLLTFEVPPGSATNGFGELKITARDVVGASLTQTIEHAFAVGNP